MVVPQAEQARIARLHTFELLARAWHSSSQKDREWSQGNAQKVIRHLEIHIFPSVGHKPIELILPAEIVHQCERSPTITANPNTAQIR
ncbi:integrase [Pusillimonas sp. T7-7]|uniref:phage integrase central domain-containing protein n=1 Tax=Pusillimonas sp. (strain T7-7) TaxID=1007105 RepID=UPI00020848D7|nr:hypothetical protein [Pusillimonas sp. T7-7]AEC21031.1 integrase [Pusillimonas sp. T7-7]